MAYNVVYPDIPNMGDLLNKDMLEAVFNIKVNQAEIKNCNLIAIGSTLEHTMLSDDPKVRIKQSIIRTLNKNVHIWGTGFIRNEADKDRGFIYKNVTIHATRGELTKKRLERVTGKKLNVPTGDGGLLAQKWLGCYPDKKYKVGIIPHFKEQSHPSVQKLLDSYESSTVIDLCQKPLEVVKKIAQCEIIISSSLHGMIVADSFHIPNIHITFNNAMFGDGNKYNDYLSAFNLEHKPFDVANGDAPDLKLVKDNYKISSEEVELKKQQLFDCFPKL